MTSRSSGAGLPLRVTALPEVLNLAALRWEVAATVRKERPGWSEDVLGDLTVVLSELVTNALVHASLGEVAVAVLEDGDDVRLEIADASGEVPRISTANGPPTGNGLGLVVVDSLAQSWGHRLSPDGKVVWAVMASRGAGPDRNSAARYIRQPSEIREYDQLGQSRAVP